MAQDMPQETAEIGKALEALQRGHLQVGTHYAVIQSALIKYRADKAHTEQVYSEDELCKIVRDVWRERVKEHAGQVKIMTSAEVVETVIRALASKGLLKTGGG